MRKNSKDAAIPLPDFNRMIPDHPQCKFLRVLGILTFDNLSVEQAAQLVHDAEGQAHRSQTLSKGKSSYLHGLRSTFAFCLGLAAPRHQYLHGGAPGQREGTGN